MSGKLIVLSGPSAVGKGTLAKHILNNYDGFHLSVSATTRAPRPGEVQGKSYFFISQGQFEKDVTSGEMLEWAVVHRQNLYGTPKTPVLRALESGLNVILEIDVQGAKQVKQAFPSAVLIFVSPPSFDDLEMRMNSRGTESQEDRQRRLETAKIELDEAANFDHLVINDEVARCAQEVVDLVKSK